MPRRKGLEQSTFFHVWNRGVDRQDIFAGPRDHETFEMLMAEAVERSGARIHAYALMSNHFHKIVQAEGEQLSDLMYHVGRSYAVWYNRVCARSGPVFDGRFSSQAITDDTMLMVEGRYVHRNPADIVGLDGLVDYPFSSLGVYAGHRPCPEWLSTETLAGPFAGPEAHLRYVRRTLASDQQYWGLRPPLVPTELTDLEQAVHRAAGVDWMTLRSRVHGVRNDALIVAVTLAVELRLGSSGQLAQWFDLPTERAVRNCSARGRMLIARNRSIAGLRRRVLDHLAVRLAQPAAA